MESIKFHPKQRRIGVAHRYASPWIGTRDAFTMLEMLLVISIMIIALGLTGRAVHSLVTSSRITDTGNHLAGLLEQARSHATVYQKTVIFRLYLGENGNAYNAAALWELNQTYDHHGELVLEEHLLTPLLRFPPPVIASVQNSIFHDPAFPIGSSTPPGEGTRTHRDIRFHPDGSVSLLANRANPYLCVISQYDTTLDNPFTLSIDAATGRISIYQK